jgi:type II secretory pathway component PulM
MDGTISPLALRLCALPRAGAAEEAGLGAVLAARWSPAAPRELAVLYASGILRFWDAVTDERDD